MPEIRLFEVQVGLRDSSLTRRSYLILQYAHESAAAFLDAFDVVRRARGAGRGAATDEEQDLLRAMVVMAAAGLDSMLKQLIRDALPTMAPAITEVREGLEGFVARRIRGDSESGQFSAGSYKFLARVLTGESVQQRVIDEYVLSLTGSSLQSPDEVKKAANALGLGSTVEIDLRQLKTIFDVRNKIIHELDIDFEAQRRNRSSRTVATMTEHANCLLETADEILVGVGELM